MSIELIRVVISNRCPVYSGGDIAHLVATGCCLQFVVLYCPLLTLADCVIDDEQPINEGQGVVMGSGIRARRPGG